jgi:cytochrome c oxidase subunit 4
MSDEHNNDSGHEHHAVNYTAIFGLLCVCTVLSIGFDLAKESLSKPVLIFLILGVAVCKASFVLLYFMHIKFERGWKYVLLAPTAVLACALPFALAPDIAFHYYNVIVPQGLIAAEDQQVTHDHPGSPTSVHGDLKHTMGDTGPAHETKEEKTAAPTEKAHGKKPH